MNTPKLLVSALMFVSVLLSACAPAATQLAPTAVPPTTAPTPTAEVSVTPPTAKVIAEWKMSMPQGFAFGFDSVWVPSHRSPNVTTRIDPTTNEVIALIEGTGFRAHQALVIGDSVWVTGETNDLAPIDPKTNTVASTAIQGAHPYIAFGFNSIWAVTQSSGLDRIDPATSNIIASIELGSGPNCVLDVRVTTTAVWVYDCDKGQLFKIDPATNTILSKTSYDKLISEAKAQTSLPAGKGTDFLWILWDSGLLRVDPTTGAGLTFLALDSAQIGDYGIPAVTDDVVWVGGSGQIERVNVATNQIDATYMLHPGYAQVGIGFGSVWVSYWDKNLVQRLDIAP